jgi:DcaP outer membrane protein
MGVSAVGESMKSAALLLLLAFAGSSCVRGQEQQDQRQAEIQQLQQRLNDIRTQIDRIDLLRGQMTQIQAEIDALQGKPVTAAPSQLQQAVQSVPPPPRPNGGIQNTQPVAPPVQFTAGQQRRGAGEATRSYDTFSEDPFAVARLYNVPLDPKYSGYFVLPGTQTLMRIGGYAKSDFIYDLRPAGNPEEFVTATIPVPGVVSTNNFTVSIRPTRLTADFRIPESAAGDVRMYFEGDFFGTNSTSFRLRHAYAQVANIVVGQTFTNFMDADSWPDTLDYEGPNSIVNVRNPQVRFGFPLLRFGSAYFSLEKPSSDIAFTVNEGTATAASPAPDTSVRLRYEGERGHFQIASMFRDIGAYLPSGREETTFGWGLSASGLWRIYKNDNVVYQVAYGQGIARYINDLSGLGLDAIPKSATNLALHPIPVFAPYVAYQHYWIPRVRSAASVGYVLVNNEGFEPDTTYHKTIDASANIIWNPFGSLNIGSEFLYGYRENVNGQHNYAPRLQFSGKYSFIKMKPD